MLTIKEALDAVLEHAQPVPATRELTVQALHCVLAEDVAADIDLPPFDKALVDGYAVRSIDLEGSDRWLCPGEEITAGRTPSRDLGPREAATIMTGAPIPLGADAVVMYERTERSPVGILIEELVVRPGQNILRRGREMCAGELVVEHGSILTPARVGVLASVGRSQVKILRPRVLILPTGDELVEPEKTPGPGQIRNSNALMLQALAIEEGARAETLPVAPDEPAQLRAALEGGLTADLLIITGGVSAGQRDLVPATLEAIGVRRVFHKVRLKPGKPLWFGVGPPRGESPATLVFGLPGNPVSGLVGFLLFIREALAVMAGKPERGGMILEARLTRGFTHRGDRPTYHPARLVEGVAGDSEGLFMEPLDWSGSADLLTVARADGFAQFSAGDREYAPGEIVGFLPMR
jgi:molybdopterin molybdotransferase